MYIRVRAALITGLVSSLMLPLATAGSATGMPRQAADSIEDAITKLAWTEVDEGQPGLPVGTTLDAITWDGGVAQVNLTLPATDAAWSTTPIGAETMGRLLGAAYAADESFGGSRVMLRRNVDDAYRPLASFVPHAADAVVVAADEVPDRAVSEEAEANYRQPVPMGGVAVVNAAQQPQGALSGVVVYCTAGHGWTAGNSSWSLQRPLLLGMNEDYGNLDQLNFFARYAFNAGATVVPFRPVGYQNIEVVLDNDDPGVTVTGTWSSGTGSMYYENGATNSGVRYLAAATSPTETGRVRFTPNLPVAGFYPVYAFALPGSNRVPQVYRVGHTGGNSEVTVDHRETGSGWIWLGEYYFDAGNAGYVEVSNGSAVAGAAIADAIRWGNGTGDIVRPGPSTISGYPRNEECQRYWAQNTLGNNAVGFSASSIWDSSSSDQNDNVSTASRWARQMNQVPAGGVQVDRWKRIYLEFHSNASGGSARGSLALISSSAPTTNQAAYATAISDEIDLDLQVLDGDFEHLWIDRASPTFTGAYGAISTTGNGNEFDATIIEVAFHDNVEDAELMRDQRVRAAIGRASVQGLVKFLAGLPGSQVPVVFAPGVPRNARVEDLGHGDVRVSWSAPFSSEAHGDPATGYVLYSSTNGLGFGVEQVLGNVSSVTLTGLPTGVTRYIRVAATNAGGESMPTPVLAMRRPEEGTARALIVSGFDSLRRFQNPTHLGGAIERQVQRDTNTFDYVVHHAEALAATSSGFASCVSDAVAGGQQALPAFDHVIWILGAQRTEDGTLGTAERTILNGYLLSGGTLFISGADLAFDLVAQGVAPAFMTDRLATDYATNDADATAATATASGIFAGLGPLDFSFAGGAPYNVYAPDALVALGDAQAALTYGGLPNGVAGVQLDAGSYRAVTLGFPFEAIASAETRQAVMQRVIDFFGSTAEPLLFDTDLDGDVDGDDYGVYSFCVQGPQVTYVDGSLCLSVDGDGDLDVDLGDFALLQQVFTGSLD